MVGQRPTTDLLNIAEFGCCEENQSCSGGYPDMICSLGRMILLACKYGRMQDWAGGPKWWAKGQPLLF